MEARKLSQEIISRIRSGFSISSVTQCVSELVLNSLDAKSKNIAVRINLKTFKIQVVDDGEGILKDDLCWIGKRYMTNKCQTIKDFENHSKFYGYKGESLCSINEHAEEITITTKHPNSDFTYSKIINKEKEDVVVAKNRPSQGTTVTVVNFLFNLPVRRNVINADLEMSLVKGNLETLSVVHPSVYFSLRNDVDKMILFASEKCESVEVALLKMKPGLKSEKFGALKLTSETMTIIGLIYKEMVDLKAQFIYVNKRPVECNGLIRLINDTLMYSKIYKKNKRKEKFCYLFNFKCANAGVGLMQYEGKIFVEFNDWDGVVKFVQVYINKFLIREGLAIEQTEVIATKEQVVPSFRLSGMGGACKGVVARRSNKNKAMCKGKSITNLIQNNCNELFGEKDCIETNSYREAKVECNKNTENSIDFQIINNYNEKSIINNDNETSAINNDNQISIINNDNQISIINNNNNKISIINNDNQISIIDKNEDNCIKNDSFRSNKNRNNNLEAKSKRSVPGKFQRNKKVVKTKRLINTKHSLKHLTMNNKETFATTAKHRELAKQLIISASNIDKDVFEKMFSGKNNPSKSFVKEINHETTILERRMRNNNGELNEDIMVSNTTFLCHQINYDNAGDTLNFDINGNKEHGFDDFPNKSLLESEITFHRIDKQYSRKNKLTAPFENQNFKKPKMFFSRHNYLNQIDGFCNNPLPIISNNAYVPENSQVMDDFCNNPNLIKKSRLTLDRNINNQKIGKALIMDKFLKSVKQKRREREEKLTSTSVSIKISRKSSNFRGKHKTSMISTISCTQMIDFRNDDSFEMENSLGFRGKFDDEFQYVEQFPINMNFTKSILKKRCDGNERMRLYSNKRNDFYSNKRNVFNFNPTTDDLEFKSAEENYTCAKFNGVFETPMFDVNNLEGNQSFNYEVNEALNYEVNESINSEESECQEINNKFPFTNFDQPLSKQCFPNYKQRIENNNFYKVNENFDDAHKNFSKYNEYNYEMKRYLKQHKIRSHENNLNRLNLLDEPKMSDRNYGNNMDLNESINCGKREEHFDGYLDRLIQKEDCNEYFYGTQKKDLQYGLQKKDCNDYLDRRIQKGDYNEYLDRGLQNKDCSQNLVYGMQKTYGNECMETQEKIFNENLNYEEHKNKLCNIDEGEMKSKLYRKPNEENAIEYFHLKERGREMEAKCNRKSKGMNLRDKVNPNKNADNDIMKQKMQSCELEYIRRNCQGENVNLNMFPNHPANQSNYPENVFSGLNDNLIRGDLNDDVYLCNNNDNVKYKQLFQRQSKIDPISTEDIIQDDFPKNNRNSVKYIQDEFGKMYPISDKQIREEFPKNHGISVKQIQDEYRRNNPISVQDFLQDEYNGKNAGNNFETNRNFELNPFHHKLNTNSEQFYTEITYQSHNVNNHLNKQQLEMENNIFIKNHCNSEYYNEACVDAEEGVESRFFKMMRNNSDKNVDDSELQMKELKREDQYNNFPKCLISKNNENGLFIANSADSELQVKEPKGEYRCNNFPNYLNSKINENALIVAKYAETHRNMKHKLDNSPCINDFKRIVENTSFGKKDRNYVGLTNEEFINQRYHKAIGDNYIKDDTKRLRGKCCQKTRTFPKVQSSIEQYCKDKNLRINDEIRNAPFNKTTANIPCKTKINNPFIKTTINKPCIKTKINHVLGKKQIDYAEFPLQENAHEFMNQDYARIKCENYVNDARNCFKNEVCQKSKLSPTVDVIHESNIQECYKDRNKLGKACLFKNQLELVFDKNCEGENKNIRKTGACSKFRKEKHEDIGSFKRGSKHDFKRMLANKNRIHTNRSRNVNHGISKGLFIKKRNNKKINDLLTFEENGVEKNENPREMKYTCEYNGVAEIENPYEIKFTSEYNGIDEIENPRKIKCTFGYNGDEEIDNPREMKFACDEEIENPREKKFTSEYNGIEYIENLREIKLKNNDAIDFHTYNIRKQETRTKAGSPNAFGTLAGVGTPTKLEIPHKITDFHANDIRKLRTLTKFGTPTKFESSIDVHTYNTRKLGTLAKFSTPITFGSPPYNTIDFHINNTEKLGTLTKFEPPTKFGSPAKDVTPTKFGIPYETIDFHRNNIEKLRTLTQFGTPTKFRSPEKNVTPTKYIIPYKTIDFHKNNIKKLGSTKFRTPIKVGTVSKLESSIKHRMKKYGVKIFTDQEKTKENLLYQKIRRDKIKMAKQRNLMKERHRLNRFEKNMKRDDLQRFQTINGNTENKNSHFKDKFDGVLNQDDFHTNLNPDEKNLHHDQACQNNSTSPYNAFCSNLNRNEKHTQHADFNDAQIRKRNSENMDFQKCHPEDQINVIQKKVSCNSENIQKCHCKDQINDLPIRKASENDFNSNLNRGENYLRHGQIGQKDCPSPYNEFCSNLNRNEKHAYHDDDFQIRSRNSENIENQKFHFKDQFDEIPHQSGPSNSENVKNCHLKHKISKQKNRHNTENIQKIQINKIPNEEDSCSSENMAFQNVHLNNQINNNPILKDTHYDFHLNHNRDDNKKLHHDQTYHKNTGNIVFSDFHEIKKNHNHNSYLHSSLKENIKSKHDANHQDINADGNINRIVREKSITEGLKKVRPIMEKLKTEGPITGRLKTERPITGRLKTERPITERLKTERPITERLKTERPITGRLKTERPITNRINTEKLVTGKTNQEVFIDDRKGDINFTESPLQSINDFLKNSKEYKERKINPRREKFALNRNEFKKTLKPNRNGTPRRKQDKVDPRRKIIDTKMFRFRNKIINNHDSVEINVTSSDLEVCENAHNIKTEQKRSRNSEAKHNEDLFGCKQYHDIKKINDAITNNIPTSSLEVCDKNGKHKYSDIKNCEDPTGCKQLKKHDVKTKAINDGIKNIIPTSSLKDCEKVGKHKFSNIKKYEDPSVCKQFKKHNVKAKIINDGIALNVPEAIIEVDEHCYDLKTDEKNTKTIFSEIKNKDISGSKQLKKHDVKTKEHINVLSHLIIRPPKRDNTHAFNKNKKEIKDLKYNPADLQSRQKIKVMEETNNNNFEIDSQKELDVNRNTKTSKKECLDESRDIEVVDENNCVRRENIDKIMGYCKFYDKGAFKKGRVFNGNVCEGKGEIGRHFNGVESVNTDNISYSQDKKERGNFCEENIEIKTNLNKVESMNTNAIFYSQCKKERIFNEKVCDKNVKIKTDLNRIESGNINKISYSPGKNERGFNEKKCEENVEIKINSNRAENMNTNKISNSQGKKERGFNEKVCEKNAEIKRNINRVENVNTDNIFYSDENIKTKENLNIIESANTNKIFYGEGKIKRVFNKNVTEENIDLNRVESINLDKIENNVKQKENTCKSHCEGILNESLNEGIQKLGHKNASSKSHHKRNVDEINCSFNKGIIKIDSSECINQAKKECINQPAKKDSQNSEIETNISIENSPILFESESNGNITFQNENQFKATTSLFNFCSMKSDNDLSTQDIQYNISTNAQEMFPTIESQFTNNMFNACNPATSKNYFNFPESSSFFTKSSQKIFENSHKENNRKNSMNLREHSKRNIFKEAKEGFQLELSGDKINFEKSIDFFNNTEINNTLFNFNENNCEEPQENNIKYFKTNTDRINNNGIKNIKQSFGNEIEKYGTSKIKINKDKENFEQPLEEGIESSESYTEIIINEGKVNVEHQLVKQIGSLEISTEKNNCEDKENFELFREEIENCEISTERIINKENLEHQFEREIESLETSTEKFNYENKDIFEQQIREGIENCDSSREKNNYEDKDNFEELFGEKIENCETSTERINNECKEYVDQQLGKKIKGCEISTQKNSNDDKENIERQSGEGIENCETSAKRNINEDKENIEKFKSCKISTDRINNKDKDNFEQPLEQEFEKYKISTDKINNEDQANMKHELETGMKYFITSRNEMTKCSSQSERRIGKTNKFFNNTKSVRMKNSNLVVETTNKDISEQTKLNATPEEQESQYFKKPSQIFNNTSNIEIELTNNENSGRKKFETISQEQKSQHFNTTKITFDLITKTGEEKLNNKIPSDSFSVKMEEVQSNNKIPSDLFPKMEEAKPNNKIPSDLFPKVKETESNNETPIGLFPKTGHSKSNNKIVRTHQQPNPLFNERLSLLSSQTNRQLTKVKPFAISPVIAQNKSLNLSAIKTTLETKSDKSSELVISLSQNEKQELLLKEYKDIKTEDQYMAEILEDFNDCDKIDNSLNKDYCEITNKNPSNELSGEMTGCDKSTNLIVENANSGDAEKMRESIDILLDEAIDELNINKGLQEVEELPKINDGGPTRATNITGLNSNLQNGANCIEDKPTFIFSVRSEFVPKGQSPILMLTEPAVVPMTSSGKAELYGALAKTYKKELGLIKWNKIILNKDPRKFFDGIYKYLSKSSSLPIISLRDNKLILKKSSHFIGDVVFSKDIFEQVRVIGQLDKKFIVTATQASTLILFDQHAVHERVRVEKLYSEYSTKLNDNGDHSKYKSKTLNDKMDIEEITENLLILKKYIATFNKYGLSYATTKTKVSISAVPLCLYNNCQRDKSTEKLKELIIALIHEEIDVIKKTKGMSKAVPKVIQNVINSEACRGAVMFGDYLDNAKCVQLILELNKCNFPFQCAHGRPTLAPIMNMAVEELKVAPINFKKLQSSMNI